MAVPSQAPLYEYAISLKAASPELNRCMQLTTLSVSDQVAPSLAYFDSKGQGVEEIQLHGPLHGTSAAREATARIGVPQTDGRGHMRGTGRGA